jgi:hypothetical protein
MTLTVRGGGVTLAADEGRVVAHDSWVDRSVLHFVVPRPKLGCILIRHVKVAVPYAAF